MFKEFLKKKNISMEAFEKMSPSEVAELQIEYTGGIKAEFNTLIENAKKGMINEEGLKNELKKFEETLKDNDSDELKNLKKSVEKNQETIKDYEEKLKTQGTSLKKLQDDGLINADKSVNKGFLRILVEKHLKDAGLVGEVEKNEFGIDVQQVKLKNNQKIGETGASQIGDLRQISKSHAIKAGEAMYVGGTGTQSVSGQAQNRAAFGTISDPLTANEHALDIFNVINITGSLMNLLIYENLEANGEIVAEGAAPSKDSRVELNDKDFKVFDFSATATISKNLLRDKGEVVDELVRQLASNIKTVVDNLIFTTEGDNISTPWGALNTGHSCENFNPLLFTGSSSKANIISVIGKAKLQARLNDWGTSSTILNPVQWDAIEDAKDANENSIKDNRLAVNSVGEIIGVKGMTKHQTMKIPDNTLLVFNSTLQNIGLRQDIETQFGHNEGDFKKRRVSFIMDMRGAYGQKAKKSSIYVTDIKGAIAILKEDAAGSLTRVKAYASGSDAAALTEATLVNAGVTGYVAANLAEYKVTIAGATSIADLSALQALIDTDNAD